MVELRQGRIMTLLCVLFICCSAVDGNDDTTTVKPGNENCTCGVKTISLYVTAGAFIVILPVIYFRRNLCCRRCQQRESIDRSQGDKPTTSTDVSVMKDPTPGDTSCRHTENNLTKGRISNVELWKLVQSSDISKENDKLSEAIEQLTGDKHGYGTCFTYFQRLCRWRDSCAPTEQMDKLYEACSRAGMGETVKKLTEFRYDVSKEVSKDDLDHVLWQICKKPSENITTLLRKLTNYSFSQDSSLSANVHRARPELQKWTKGNLVINPAVMLSMRLDEFCDEDKYFFTVSEEEKRPLPDADIRIHARNFSKAHCKKITNIISTKGKYKRNKVEKVVKAILDENVTDLFNTYQMITEWRDEQECSNYEKRKRLQKAMEGVQKPSTSNEISLDEVDQLASNKGNAEAAYELLMKDIKSFAAILGVDESKLIKYKRSSSSSQSPRGTVELVADVTSKKGGKLF